MVNISQAIKYPNLNNLEAEIILANTLDKDRSFLHAHPDLLLSDHVKKLFITRCERRLSKEPIDYILGFKEFYSLKFYVDKNVLIPRPETENLVDKVIKYANGKHMIIYDVGTGSGCIAVSLAKNLPLANIFASDISLKALNVARKNAKLHNVESKIKFLYGNLLSPINFKVDIIVANLPYIQTKNITALEPKIKDWEPIKALDGGADGMEIYRHLFQTASKKLFANGKIFYEFDGGVFEKNN